MTENLLTRRHYNLHYGGSPAGAKSGRRLEMRGPAIPDLITTVPDASVADVAAAVRAAAAAFPAWSRTDPRESVRSLRRLANLPRSRVQHPAAIEPAVTGRPIRQMRAQMTPIAGQPKAGVIWVNDHPMNDPRSVWGAWGGKRLRRGKRLECAQKLSEQEESYPRKKSVMVRTAPAFDDWFPCGGCNR